MAKEEKVLNEKMDINTPFKDFVRKFKKQKTAIVAMFFIIALVILAFISYQIAPYALMSMITRRSCRDPAQPTGLEQTSLGGICFQGSSAVPGSP